MFWKGNKDMSDIITKCSYIDMHCDSLCRGFRENDPDSLFDGKGMQSISLMAKAQQLCQFFAVFFPPRKGDTLFDYQDRPLPQDDEYFNIMRDSLLKEVKIHSDVIDMAYCSSDIITNRKAGKCSAVLTIEDGRMVNGEIDKLSKLYESGVRAIALTWNCPNCFGSPNSCDPKIMNKGLTDFGRDAVREMNRLGIMVDVSHLSDGGFRDVYDVSEKPFIASHSDCRALTSQPRNLTDEMIRMIAEKSGVIGVNLEETFCTPDGHDIDCRIEYLVEHVLHLLKVGGEDVIGIGSDYDGIENAGELHDPTYMYKLFDALRKNGMTSVQIAKMESGNVLRVMRDVIG